jgi:hypothetical protein
VVVIVGSMNGVAVAIVEVVDVVPVRQWFVAAAGSMLMDVFLT